MRHISKQRTRAYKGMRHIHEEIERRQDRRDEELTSEHGGAAHSQCGRKRAYPTKRLAHAAAGRGMQGSVRLRAYRCPYCGMWHLTHKFGGRRDGSTAV